MNQSVQIKEFPLPCDEIVDKLLMAVQDTGWKLSKMRYEMTLLEASQLKHHIHNGKETDVTYKLTAVWADLDGSTELELVVIEEDFDWTENECHNRCQALMDTLVHSFNITEPAADFVEEVESHN